MKPAHVFPTRRHAVLAVAVAATLLLSVVFDLTVFATTLFPAMWVLVLRPGRDACGVA